jgi:hypothetical protein
MQPEELVEFLISNKEITLNLLENGLTRITPSDTLD